MARIRFSLAALMGMVILTALGLVALRNASAAWANATFTITLTLLLCAVLGLIYRRHHARAFWLGFALFGWMYVGLVNAPWFEKHIGPRLITDTILRELHTRVFSGLEGTINLNGLELSMAERPSRPGVTLKQQQFQFALGTSRIVRSPLSINRVRVRDESLLELAALDTNEIQLFAKAPGTTFITIWDTVDRGHTVQVTIKPGTWTPSVLHFRQVGHSLFALLFALLGGYVARCFYTASEK